MYVQYWFLLPLRKYIWKRNSFLNIWFCSQFYNWHLSAYQFYFCFKMHGRNTLACVALIIPFPFKKDEIWDSVFSEMSCSFVLHIYKLCNYCWNQIQCNWYKIWYVYWIYLLSFLLRILKAILFYLIVLIIIDLSISPCAIILVVSQDLFIITMLFICGMLATI